MAKKKEADGSDTIQSFDESESLTDIGFYKTLFKLYWNTRKICIPAIVTEKVSEKEEDKGKITVRPLVNLSKCTKDGRKGIERADVKVWPIQMRHGGFTVTAPIFVGDTGYLVAGDRFYDNVVKENSQSITEEVDDVKNSPNKGPQDLQAFDADEWEYGFFIPSSWYSEEQPEEFKDKIVFGNIQEGDKSAYITIDKEGNIVLHGLEFKVEAKTTDITGELHVEGDQKNDKNLEIGENLTVEGDSNLKGDVSIGGDADIEGNTHIHQDLEVDGNATIHKDLTVDGNTTIKGELNVDGETHFHFGSGEGSEEATLTDAEIITGYDGESNTFSKWAGKILRTEGETEIIDGPPGGGGGEAYVDDVSIGKDGSGKIEIKGYKSTLTSGSLAESLFGSGLTSSLVARPSTSSSPSFISSGSIDASTGLKSTTANGKVTLKSTCINDITASASVTDGETTNLTLTASKKSGGENDPAKWEVKLTGTVKSTDPTPAPSIDLSSDESEDSPATKLTLTIDDSTKDVNLIPESAISGTYEIITDVYYEPSEKKLQYEFQKWTFSHGILMKVESNPEGSPYTIFETVEHDPEE